MDRERIEQSLPVLAARRIVSMQIPVYAANACYFLILAVFPALLLILASVPYLPYSAEDLIHLLEAVLPTALMGAAESFVVSTYYNSSGAILSISAITALWSASRGIVGLLTGLNHIYGVHEDRGYIYTRLISVFYTFIFLLVLVLTLVMQVFGQRIERWFYGIDRPIFQLILNIIDWRSVWLLVVQILAFAVIYMVLPNRHNRFWTSLPGAAVAAVGWQLFSNVFSFYVDHVASYTNIYGSLYTLALGMLWLYICICLFLFGGGVNRMIQQWLKE